MSDKLQIMETNELLKKIFLEEYKYFKDQDGNSIFVEQDNPTSNQLVCNSSEIELKRTFLENLYTIIVEEPKPYTYVLLGDAGQGKTRVALELCRLIWERNPSSSLPIPLYISLATISLIGYPTSLSDCISLYAKRNETDLNWILQAKLVVFLDSYDEIVLDSEITAWEPGNNTKIVHLIRKDSFSLEEKSRFFSKCGHKSEYILQDFSDESIEKYEKHFKNTLNISEFESYFKCKFWIVRHVPNMITDLGKNPLMLKLLLESVPCILNFLKTETELWKLRALIYDHVTSKWFERYIKKCARTQKDEMEIEMEHLKIYCSAQAINWSHSLILREPRPKQDPIDFLEPFQDQEFLATHWERDRKIFLEKADYLRAIRSSLPANLENDSCKFFHFSLFEYFLDKELFSGTVGQYEYMLKLKMGETKIPLSVFNLNLVNKDYLTILSDLSKEARNNSSFVKLLFELVLASKHKTFLKTIAANCATILNLAGESFSGRDFTHIQIPGANLSYSLCGNTDFRGSDLTNVSFNNSWLTQSKFEGSNFNGLKIGFQQTFSMGKQIPTQIEFWKGSNEKFKLNNQIFIFIGFKTSEGSLSVFQFNSDTGQAINPLKPFKIKVQADSSTSPNYSDKCAFQIFKNHITLWNISEIKIFDLVTGKEMVNPNFTIETKDHKIYSIKKDRNLSVPSVEIPYNVKPESNSIVQLKIDQTGNFLANVFDSFVDKGITDSLDVVIYQGNMACRSSLNMKVRVNCERCITGIDFCEQNETFVFVFQGGLGIINLNDFSLKTIYRNSSPDMEKVFGSETEQSLRYFCPSAIDPENNKLIALFGQLESSQMQKLFVLDMDSLMIVHDLNASDMFGATHSPTLNVSPRILAYSANFLACISGSLVSSTSNLRIWDTTNTAYTLIYFQAFEETISELAIGQPCTGISWVALRGQKNPIVTVLEISGTNATNSEEIDVKALFLKKFHPTTTVPRDVLYIYAVQISADLKQIFVVEFKNLLEKKDEMTLKDYIFEIWDTGTGKRFEFPIERIVYCFADWEVPGKLMIIVECGNRETQARFYDSNKGELIQCFIVNEMKWLLYRVNVHNCNDIYLCNTEDEERFELFRYSISGDSLSFEQIPNLNGFVFPNTKSRYAIKRGNISEGKTLIQLWDLVTMEIVVEEYFDYKSLNVVHENEFFVLTQTALHVCKLSDKAWEPVRNLENLPEPIEDITFFEPTFQIFAMRGRQENSFTLWSYPDIKLKATVRLWFQFKTVSLLQSTKTSFRILVCQTLNNAMVCIEFDVSKDFHWSLIWTRTSYMDFQLDQALMKNVLNLDALNEKIMQESGAEGQKSIPREVYVAKGDLIFPILGSANLPKTSMFHKKSGQKLVFDANHWIVSAIAIKTKVSGRQRREHSCLTAEGEINCRRFTFRAELSTKQGFPFIQVNPFKSIKEITDWIVEEGIVGKWVYFQKQITKEEGDMLVESILLDRRNTYGVRLENCITWIEDKLGVIGIRFEKSRWDNIVNRAQKFKRSLVFAQNESANDSRL